jgi:hypothetical protein
MVTGKITTNLLLNQGLTNYGTMSQIHLFLQINLTGIQSIKFIHLCTVYSLSCVTRAELSKCKGNYVPQTLKCFLSGHLQRKFTNPYSKSWRSQCQPEIDKDSTSKRDP